MKNVAPKEIAGLPFVAEVPFSEEDVEFLQSLIEKRKHGMKFILNCSLIIFVALLAVIRLLMIEGLHLNTITLVVSVVISNVLFMSGTIFANFKRQIKQMEADLKNSYLRRFKGLVTQSAHPLVAKALLVKDEKQIQTVDVLPTSGKVHRVNDAMLWTWTEISETS